MRQLERESDLKCKLKCAIKRKVDYYELNNTLILKNGIIFKCPDYINLYIEREKKYVGLIKVKFVSGKKIYPGALKY